MNIIDKQVWPEGNWKPINFTFAGPGAVSVILSKKLNNSGVFKTPQGKAILEKIKERKKKAIKQGYNKVKSATTENELYMPSILFEIAKVNSNTNKLKLYTQQKWKRLGGWDPWVSALAPQNKVGPNGFLTYGNRTYNTLPQYNIWNPNGTRPNRNTMQDLNLIWKAEQLLLQRHKNMHAGKKYTNHPLWEARRLLSQVKNKSSYVYRNINGKVKKEENWHKESNNKRINDGNSLFHLNLIEKDLKSQGHLDSSTHGQSLRNKLNAKIRQVANKELEIISHRMNKLTTLNVLNHFEGLEKKSGTLNNPIIGKRIREKISEKRRQLQAEKVAANAAKAAKAKANANINLQMYSGWINSNSSLNSLNHTKKLLNNAKAFNNPSYGRVLRSKFNAKKRQLQSKGSAPVKKWFW
jgi:cell division protein ZapA (FtsZ GTPase activity inhibitor)